MTDDRLPADPTRAGRLIAAQFPHWADLPIRPVETPGWDNRSFRLGDALKLRLPAAARYADQPAKEHRWLPHLAAHLPVEVPRALALGAPGPDWPWPWSVQGWLPGDPAAVPAGEGPARDLAGFLVALWSVPVAGGPMPGPHSFHRGGDLSVCDGETRAALPAAGPEAARAKALWDAALASRASGPPVWVHGDMAAGNLLLRDGRLAAVIDWGLCAVGDPACDLVPAWTLFDAPARAVFRAGLPADPDLWARARGWALWKALLILSGRADGAQAAAARRTLDALLDDA